MSTYFSVVCLDSSHLAVLEVCPPGSDWSLPTGTADSTEVLEAAAESVIFSMYSLRVQILGLLAPPLAPVNRHILLATPVSFPATLPAATRWSRVDNSVSALRPLWSRWASVASVMQPAGAYEVPSNPKTATYPPPRPKVTLVTASTIPGTETASGSARPLSVRYDILPCQTPSKTFVTAAPRGAYSTARTVGGWRVLELSAHVSRLADSARIMADRSLPTAPEEGPAAVTPPKNPAPRASTARADVTTSADAPQPGTGQVRLPALCEDRPFLRTVLCQSARLAISSWLAVHGTTAGDAEAGGAADGSTLCKVPDTRDAEFRLTFLLVSDTLTNEAAAGEAAAGGAALPRGATGLAGLKPVHGGGSLFCHCEPLPPPPSPPIAVEARRCVRSAVAAKDSAWALQRQAVVSLLADGAEEVLLMEADGSLLEGSQTNFYAIRADTGALVTAGDDRVLAGTVRAVALREAQRRGWPVELRPPNVAEARAGAWAGCAISSTSRLLLPVNTVHQPADGERVRPGDVDIIFDRAQHTQGAYADRIDELQEAVAAAIQGASESVLDE
eukprot:TRINITY_DN44275_c0_g1_i1.p1 TRINITY_DN44275_c0_g1~~TRINITY_DN44275_c0_g1_i1.p1  ORF type:complete len:560 (+),score=77.95 TRINITY_DN44275_c0_g1_i1:205-1884(+)